MYTQGCQIPWDIAVRNIAPCLSEVHTDLGVPHLQLETWPPNLGVLCLRTLSSTTGVCRWVSSKPRNHVRSEGPARSPLCPQPRAEGGIPGETVSPEPRAQSTAPPGDPAKDMSFPNGNSNQKRTPPPSPPLPPICPDTQERGLRRTSQHRLETAPGPGGSHESPEVTVTHTRVLSPHSQDISNLGQPGQLNPRTVGADGGRDLGQGSPTPRGP